MIIVKFLSHKFLFFSAAFKRVKMAILLSSLIGSLVVLVAVYGQENTNDYKCLNVPTGTTTVDLPTMLADSYYVSFHFGFLLFSLRCIRFKSQFRLKKANINVKITRCIWCACNILEKIYIS